MRCDLMRCDTRTEIVENRLKFAARRFNAAVEAIELITLAHP